MPDRTPEERLLLACVRYVPSQAGPARVDELFDRSIDWGTLGRLAEAHEVWARLLGVLRSAQPAGSRPLREALEERLLRTTAQNLARTSQLAQILEWLRVGGVSAVAFKGPSLAALGSDHVGGRRSVDLDLLVSRRAAPVARAVLIGRGYSLANDGPDGLGGAFPPAGREDLFLPPDRFLAPVEVQVSVATWWLEVALEVEEVINRAIAVRVAGVPLVTLCKEDLLLALAVHGARDRWARLRHFLDVDAAVRACPDWTAVVARARTARILRLLWIAVLLSHEVLGTPVPEPVLRAARHDRPAVHLARHFSAALFASPGGLPRWMQEPWMHARSREHLRDQMRCGLRLLLWRYVIWPWDRRRARLREPRVASGGRPTG